MSSPRAKVHILVGPRSTVRVRILSTPITAHGPTRQLTSVPRAHTIMQMKY